MTHLHNSDGDYLVLHAIDKAVFLVYASRSIASIIAHKGFRFASTLVWMDAQFLKQSVYFLLCLPYRHYVPVHEALPRPLVSVLCGTSQTEHLFDIVKADLASHPLLFLLHTLLE